MHFAHAFWAAVFPRLRHLAAHTKMGSLSGLLTDRGLGMGIR
jgi:hypothetical protein